jgi:pilus assembly protein CpaB
MNRRTRTILVFAIAIVAAVVAGLSVYRVAQRLEARQVGAPVHTVVVAARPVSLGAQLSAADVKVIPWPSAGRLAGTFAQVEDVVGRGVIEPLAENEPLTEAKVAAAGAGAGLPPVIPRGMRAISVRVNEVIGVAGFVVPGTRVDVVVTVDSDDERGQMSRVVVSNAQVLTAGTRYDQDRSKDGKPIPSTVVTLMVTPEDAERIALAETGGRVMLTLRNPLDSAPTVTRGIRLASLLGEAERPAAPVARAKAAPKPAPAVVPAAAPAPYTVETIRAAKRAQEVVR